MNFHKITRIHNASVSKGEPFCILNVIPKESVTDILNVLYTAYIAGKSSIKRVRLYYAYPFDVSNASYKDIDFAGISLYLNNNKHLFKEPSEEIRYLEHLEASAVGREIEGKKPFVYKIEMYSSIPALTDSQQMVRESPSEFNLPYNLRFTERLTASITGPKGHAHDNCYELMLSSGEIILTGSVVSHYVAIGEIIKHQEELLPFFSSLFHDQFLYIVNENFDDIKDLSYVFNDGNKSSVTGTWHSDFIITPVTAGKQGYMEINFTGNVLGEESTCNFKFYKWKDGLLVNDIWVFNLNVNSGPKKKEPPAKDERFALDA